MPRLHEFETLLNTLPEAERALILRWAVGELSRAFPGIDVRPDVCGGEPCIVRTRIPVWILKQSRRLGVDDETLLANYPTLRPEDLENAWAYVQAHDAEINEQIRENAA